MNQYFTIKEIKIFFKDLQLAKYDEKLRILVGFLSTKSESFKESSWVEEKEILAKDVESKKSCIFSLIDKTVNT